MRLAQLALLDYKDYQDLLELLDLLVHWDPEASKAALATLVLPEYQVKRRTAFCLLISESNNTPFNLPYLIYVRLRLGLVCSCSKPMSVLVGVIACPHWRL